MSESKTNRCDYTLPTLPEHNGWNNELDKPYWFAVFVFQHGQQCAEAAREPLLARLREVCQTLVAAVGANGPCSAEDAAARAVARIAELNGQIERQAAVLRQQRAQIAELERSRDFYRRRCDLLQEWQSRMRDPERTLVCDVLANGLTLPDPNGTRYGHMKESGDA